MFGSYCFRCIIRSSVCFERMHQCLLKDLPVALSFALLCLRFPGMGLPSHLVLYNLLGLGHLKLQLPHVVVFLSQLRCGQSLGWISSPLVALFWACTVTSPEEDQFLIGLVARAHVVSIVEILRETLTLSIQLMLSRLRFKMTIAVMLCVELRNT